LCCEEKYCDLALMIGNNCYAGDCASDELCSAVPVPPGSFQRSQIAYISAPGRKKPEDRWVNADWSLVYLIVSALVIGISLLGTAWTVCLCAIRRHRRKRKRKKKDVPGHPTGMDRETSIRDIDMDEAVGTSSRNGTFTSDESQNLSCPQLLDHRNLSNNRISDNRVIREEKRRAATSALCSISGAGEKQKKKKKPDPSKVYRKMSTEELFSLGNK